MENPNTRLWLLALLSLSLLVISAVFNTFSFLILLGLSPLFAIFNEFNKTGSERSQLKNYGYILAILALGFGSWGLSFSTPEPVHFMQGALFGIAISLSFLIYLFTNKYAKNRIGLFTILIYWLAIEYLLYRYIPTFANYFLGAVFSHDTYLISWDLYTGLQGVSFWIILVNILFYFALFKDLAIFNSKIRWLSIIYTLVIVVIPFAMNISSEAIIPIDLISMEAASKQLTGSGEYLGKNAVWVSILMICYGFVQRKTKK
ncbi:hypothetical protein LVD15_09640 [Fulvivirga maritima]|uniref:hypothetical protein n=1 Tax=Fulvivirga maritima TaxID=2904247 RepID=UPI001F278F63|nr:hypothetical protein [Fulvivirga maritima]UII28665.1 hypothetical protein LVD15_09640 [Fulvivirga maritima]